MNIVSIVSPPSKSLYNKLFNLFEGHKIIYFPELIRNNMSNNSNLWSSINNDILNGQTIKNKDICNVILEQIIKNINEDYMILGFPRTTQQLKCLNDLLVSEKIKYKLIGVFSKSENDTNLIKSFKEVGNDVIETPNFDDLNLQMVRAKLNNS